MSKAKWEDYTEQEREEMMNLMDNHHGSLPGTFYGSDDLSEFEARIQRLALIIATKNARVSTKDNGDSTYTHVFDFSKKSEPPPA